MYLREIWEKQLIPVQRAHVYRLLAEVVEAGAAGQIGRGEITQETFEAMKRRHQGLQPVYGAARSVDPNMEQMRSELESVRQELAGIRADYARLTERQANEWEQFHATWNQAAEYIHSRFVALETRETLWQGIVSRLSSVWSALAVRLPQRHTEEPEIQSPLIYESQVACASQLRRG